MSSKKIDFDLEELCNGRFIWTLKFSRDELYSTCSREDLLRLLLVSFYETKTLY